MKPSGKRLGISGLITICWLLSIVAPLSSAQVRVLMMATTTSTDNTGLLDAMAPRLEQATGIELRWVAVGTGKALKLGESCDVDVLMVHDPVSEHEFLRRGFGIDRREIMYNDFVLIGPAADPAGIGGKPVIDALRAIRKEGAVFVSRGDQSGTHKKEMALWKEVGAPLPEREHWYIQTGQGMLATILVAAEKNGYTLTDRGTYLKYETGAHGRPALGILVQGDPGLRNQYSVISVHPGRCPKARHDLARAFADWIAGAEGQKCIAGFTVKGAQLFIPNAGGCVPDAGTERKTAPPKP